MLHNGWAEAFHKGELLPRARPCKPGKLAVARWLAREAIPQGEP